MGHAKNKVEWCLKKAERELKESGNQECTFALIYSLTEDEKIDFDEELLNRIASLEIKEVTSEKTITEIRERYQYGAELSIRDNLYRELWNWQKRLSPRPNSF